MDVELGTFKLTDAYEAAIRYPFRPGAARAVVGVIANPCEKSPFPISVSFYFFPPFKYFPSIIFSFQRIDYS